MEASNFETHLLSTNCRYALRFSRYDLALISARVQAYGDSEIAFRGLRLTSAAASGARHEVHELILTKHGQTSLDPKHPNP